jgi:pimeloyl-ACP methyl ester carboxylesterase
VRKVPIDFGALLGAARDPRWYAGITAPTLLVSGRSSQESVRQIARTLWAAMPSAQFVELLGDHMLPIRDPAAFNLEVEGFFGALRVRRGMLRAAGMG